MQAGFKSGCLAFGIWSSGFGLGTGPWDLDLGFAAPRPYTGAGMALTIRRSAAATALRSSSASEVWPHQRQPVAQHGLHQVEHVLGHHEIAAVQQRPRLRGQLERQAAAHADARP